uniref:Uncharacterized protein n=1 Tax=Heterorhabditis bacteriophora TaxID=37862 RepID=A0A1I7WQD0_HETBA
MALCEHGYSDNYTEEELGDVLEEMGKTIDPAYIPRLKSEIDRVVAEIDKENDDCYEADMLPLFSSLRLDDSIQENRLGTRNMQNILFSDSPIRSTRHNAVTNAQVVRNQYLKNINSNIIPLALQTNAEDDEMRQHNPAAHALLNDAYRCLGNIYRNFHYLDRVELSFYRVHIIKIGSIFDFTL